MALTDRRGRGIRVTCSEPFSFNARFEHDAALTAATTTAEVAVGDTVEVNIDAAVRGLGTGACGPDVQSRHQVAPGIWRWSMFLAPEHVVSD